MIQYHDQPIGTVRLYGAREKSFCWGSWILNERRPNHAGMGSALSFYAYAVDHLGFESAHFDVKKGNERVCLFHERFGAKRVRECDIDVFYALDRESIQHSRLRYSKYLLDGVTGLGGPVPGSFKGIGTSWRR